MHPSFRNLTVLLLVVLAAVLVSSTVWVTSDSSAGEGDYPASFEELNGSVEITDVEVEFQSFHPSITTPDVDAYIGTYGADDSRVFILAQNNGSVEGYLQITGFAVPHVYKIPATGDMVSIELFTGSPAGMYVTPRLGVVGLEGYGSNPNSPSIDSCIGVDGRYFRYAHGSGEAVYYDASTGTLALDKGRMAYYAGSAEDHVVLVPGTNTTFVRVNEGALTFDLVESEGLATVSLKDSGGNALADFSAVKYDDVSGQGRIRIDPLAAAGVMEVSNISGSPFKLKIATTSFVHQLSNVNTGPSPQGDFRCTYDDFITDVVKVHGDVMRLDTSTATAFEIDEGTTLAVDNGRFQAVSSIAGVARGSVVEDVLDITEGTVTGFYKAPTYQTQLRFGDLVLRVDNGYWDEAGYFDLAYCVALSCTDSLLTVTHRGGNTYVDLVVDDSNPMSIKCARLGWKDLGDSPEYAISQSRQVTLVSGCITEGVNSVSGYVPYPITVAGVLCTPAAWDGEEDYKTYLSENTVDSLPCLDSGSVSVPAGSTVQVRTYPVVPDSDDVVMMCDNLGSIAGVFVKLPVGTGATVSGIEMSNYGNTVASLSCTDNGYLNILEGVIEVSEYDGYKNITVGESAALVYLGYRYVEVRDGARLAINSRDVKITLSGSASVIRRNADGAEYPNDTFYCDGTCTLVSPSSPERTIILESGKMSVTPGSSGLNVTVLKGTVAGSSTYTLHSYATIMENVNGVPRVSLGTIDLDAGESAILAGVVLTNSDVDPWTVTADSETRANLTLDVGTTYTFDGEPFYVTTSSETEYQLVLIEGNIALNGALFGDGMFDVHLGNGQKLKFYDVDPVEGGTQFISEANGTVLSRLVPNTTLLSGTVAVTPSNSVYLSDLVSVHNIGTEDIHVIHGESSNQVTVQPHQSFRTESMSYTAGDEIVTLTIGSSGEIEGTYHLVAGGDYTFGSLAIHAVTDGTATYSGGSLTLTSGTITYESGSVIIAGSEVSNAGQTDLTVSAGASSVVLLDGTLAIGAGGRVTVGTSTLVTIADSEVMNDGGVPQLYSGAVTSDSEYRLNHGIVTFTLPSDISARIDGATMYLSYSGSGFTLQMDSRTVSLTCPAGKTFDIEMAHEDLLGIPFAPAGLTTYTLEADPGVPISIIGTFIGFYVSEAISMEVGTASIPSFSGKVQIMGGHDMLLSEGVTIGGLSDMVKVSSTGVAGELWTVDIPSGDLVTTINSEGEIEHIDAPGDMTVKVNSTGQFWIDHVLEVGTPQTINGVEYSTDSGAMLHTYQGLNVLDSGSVSFAASGWINLNDAVRVQAGTGAGQVVVECPAVGETMFTVTVPDGMTVTTSGSAEIGSFKAENGNEDVLVDGSGVFHKTYDLNTGDTVTILGSVYEAAEDGTRLTLDGDVIELVAGSVIVRKSSILVDGVTVEVHSDLGAGDDPGTIVSVDRHMTMGSGQSVTLVRGTSSYVVGTGVGETASLSFTGALVVSLESGCIRLQNGESFLFITAQTVKFATTADGTSVKRVGDTLTLLSGGITSASAYSFIFSDVTVSVGADVISVVTPSADLEIDLPDASAQLSVGGVDYSIGREGSGAVPMVLKLSSGALCLPTTVAGLTRYTLTVGDQGSFGFEGDAGYRISCTSSGTTSFDIDSGRPTLTSGRVSLTRAGGLYIGTGVLVSGNSPFQIEAPAQTGELFQVTLGADVIVTTSVSGAEVDSFESTVGETIGLDTDGRFSSTYTLNKDEVARIQDAVYTATADGTVISHEKGANHLVSGGVRFGETDIVVGGVTVDNPSAVPVTVSADRQLTFTGSSGISLTKGAVIRELRAEGECGITFMADADLALTLLTGTIVLMADETVTVGTTLYEARADSTMLRLDSDGLTLSSGSIISAAAYSYIFSGTTVSVGAGVVSSISQGTLHLALPDIAGAVTVDGVGYSLGKDSTETRPVELVLSSALLFPTTVSGVTSYTVTVDDQGAIAFGLTDGTEIEYTSLGTSQFKILPGKPVLVSGGLSSSVAGQAYINDNIRVSVDSKFTLSAPASPATLFSLGLQAGSTAVTSDASGEIDRFSAPSTSGEIVGIDVDGGFERSYTLNAGESVIIQDKTFTAKVDGTVIIHRNAVNTLASGAVIIGENEIFVGSVKVRNSSGTEITVTSEGRLSLAMGSAVTLVTGTVARVLNTPDSCEVSFTDEAEPVVTLVTGTISLDVEEQVSFGTVVLKAGSDSTLLKVADGQLVLSSGSMTSATPYTFTAGGMAVSVGAGTVSTVTQSGFTLGLPDISGTVTVDGVEYQFGRESTTAVPVTIACQSGVLGLPLSVSGLSAYTVTVGDQGVFAFTEEGTAPVTLTSQGFATFNVLSGKAVLTEGSMVSAVAGQMHLSEDLWVSVDSRYTLEAPVPPSTLHRVTIAAGTTVTTRDSSGVIDSFTSVYAETLGIGTDGLIERTYVLAAGESVIIGGRTFTATDGGATIVHRGSVDTLVLGEVTFSGAEIDVGDVTVSCTAGTVTVSSERHVSFSSAAVPTLVRGTVSRSLHTLQSCVVEFADDDAVTLGLVSGTILLSAGESVTFGTTPITAESDSTEIGTDSGLPVLHSGSITSIAQYGFVFDGRTFTVPSGTVATVGQTGVDLALPDISGDVVIDGVTYTFVRGSPTVTPVTISVTSGVPRIPVTVPNVSLYELSVTGQGGIVFTDAGTSLMEMTCTASAVFSVTPGKPVLTGGEVDIPASGIVRIGENLTVGATGPFTVRSPTAPGGLYVLTLAAGVTATSYGADGAVDSFVAPSAGQVEILDDGHFRYTYNLVQGAQVIIGGQTLTAVSENVTVTLLDGCPNLIAGTVTYRSNGIYTNGTVLVDLSQADNTQVSADRTLVILGGQTVRLVKGADSRTFVTSGACTLGYDDNLVVRVINGRYDLSAGESMAFGDLVTVTAYADSTLDFDGSDLTLVSGEISLSSVCPVSVAGRTLSVSVGTRMSVSATSSALGITLVNPVGSFTLDGVQYSLTFSGAQTFTEVGVTVSGQDVRLPQDASLGTYSVEVGDGGRLVFGSAAAVSAGLGLLSHGATVTVGPADVALVAGSLELDPTSLIHLTGDVSVQNLGTGNLAVIRGAALDEVVLGAGQTVVTNRETYTAGNTEETLTVDSAGYLGRTYTLNNGESAIVFGDTFTATEDSTVISHAGGVTSLMSGAVRYGMLGINIGAVTVENLSQTEVNVRAVMEIDLLQGQSVRLSDGFSHREFVATAPCTIGFDADLRINLMEGTVDLGSGDSLLVGGVNFTAGEASSISFVNGIVTLMSGTVTADVSVTITVGDYRISNTVGGGLTVRHSAGETGFTLAAGTAVLERSGASMNLELMGQVPVDFRVYDIGMFDASVADGASFTFGSTTYVFAFPDSARREVTFEGTVMEFDMSSSASQAGVLLDLLQQGEGSVRVLDQSSGEHTVSTHGGFHLILEDRTVRIETSSELTVSSVTGIRTYVPSATSTCTLAYDLDTDVADVAGGEVTVTAGTVLGCNGTHVVCSEGSLSLTSSGVFGTSAQSRLKIIMANDHYDVRSTSAVAGIGLTALCADLHTYADFRADVLGVLQNNPLGVPDAQVYVDRVNALVYDLSLTYAQNKDLIDAIYDEYQSIGRDENERSFEAYKTGLLSELRALHSSGESQAVANRIDYCIDSINRTYYDSALGYLDNLHRLDAYSRVSIESEIVILNEESFQTYKTEVLVEIEALHEGETCVSEKTLVDVAYGAAVSAQYESGRSFDENRKALDDIISQCKQDLTKFRDDTDSFEIYKRVKMRYIETQDTFGSEEVVQLIRTYSDRVKALNFSDRRDLAGNLARVDEVVASFDSEVAKVGASRFGAFKVTILAELNSMMASYEAPEVKALISDSLFEVENYYYDSGVSYGSNTNRLNDILGTLRGEIEIVMSGLLENFEKYCREYLDLFADRRTDPMYSAKDYQDAFDTAISGISALRYDRSLNLKGNEVRADDIATTLHESVYLISSEHVKAEFARYRGEALDYVSHKVVSGATDAINSLADEIKGRIKAVEYDPALSAEENDAAVRVLVEEFETRLAPLVQHADFDRVVDAGVDYLIERYGAYEVLSAELTADILALRAVAYDDAMTLEDNQKVIETMVNGFSVELFKQRQKSARGDYDNYRDYLIYEIDRTLPANAPQELVTLAREHTDRIKAADFDETSYLYNKSVVHRIYLDYLDRAVPVLIRVHKDVIISGLKALADGSRPVDDAIARGESSVRGYVPLNDLDQDLSRLDTLKELAELGIGYAKARSDESAFSSFVDVRVSVIRGLPCIGERAVALRDSTLADIAGIMSSGRSLADRAKAVEDADLSFLTRHTFLCAAASASEEIHREHIFGESPAAAALIDRYADMVANLPYDEGWSVFGGTDRIVALLDEFQGALFQRRVLDNSTVSGELNADGTSSVTGGVAEYPEGSDEIWGIVGNAKGMGGSSSVVFRKVDVPVDPYSGRMMPAEGSTIAALSDGKVLGAFEIDIYNGGQKVSAFSGSYVVKILLPAEMRGYRTMQVAYVDEFGDVQVYDAEVEGNFLVFATTHFSVFSVIGVNPEVARYYDAYVFAIAVVLVVAFLLYMSRVVVFIPEDGRKAYAYSFGAPEGEIVNPFADDGRRLVGWRREGTEELIPADADASVLGGSRIIRISPVWEEENEGGKA